ncbi:bleomycin resistance protein [Deinococcus cellulosilyticus]|uniref:VOC domain-containing protein n=1 Tax=Deinococcus cellulosilyticus (strain DSM 18568 / NBRC 106333 / KACC 11606 / 5516J-15) TaxID=1223518 RepID=A0A511NAS8_DEIC1|nr:bleomycin resistance protein [Deinococcus cellulosilyticus]GEM49939.1 hypothetical protein DC3_55740 [Deinococcus cellulosilyticus NBRC 106333 = KACC 11606]
MTSPIRDLLSLTLEVNHLQKARDFYEKVIGLQVLSFDEDQGNCTLGFPSGQRLNLWMPVTRQQNSERLSRVRARGGTHVHWAMQIPRGTLQRAREHLGQSGIPWQEINLASEDQPADIGLYFWDPAFHGLELREVDLQDERFPEVPPGDLPETGLPVVGLREVALAFEDYQGMKERLPEAYGFAFLKEMEERNFAQFTLGPEPERDGLFTCRRWLYAWDPQVGLADMLGGEHATVQFLADVDAVEARVKQAGLEHFRDQTGLVVRDPEGHVFEFVEEAPNA